MVYSKTDSDSPLILRGLAVVDSRTDSDSQRILQVMVESRTDFSFPEICAPEYTLKKIEQEKILCRLLACISLYFSHDDPSKSFQKTIGFGMFMRKDEQVN